MRNRFPGRMISESNPHRTPMSRLAIISQLFEDLKIYGKGLNGRHPGNRLASFPPRFSEIDVSLVEAKRQYRAFADLMENQGRRQEALSARRAAKALEEMRKANSQEIWLLHRLLRHLSANREECSPELLEQCCERMLLRQQSRCSEESVRALAEGRRAPAR